MSRRYISYDEAVSLLPDGEMVHTFINEPFGLTGADWNRADVLDKLKKSDIIEITGKMARGTNHGICAYNKTTKYQSEILFIETDKERLETFDMEKEDDDAD